ncbi:MAG TPA: folylpolyglutamate synthase/dihydrofolate synthase family protein [Bacilli bacterium]|nr:folylpolyglutamate synthase/dihydrofolate synthase family protein [Bacilli bacterium]
MSAIEWIHQFDRFDGRTGIKPGLERMEAMLERLGNPHHNLKFLHVAGTNGKGSTCAYLAAILEQAGYRVGLFTSPYLTAFHDRMAVGGHNIADVELEALVERIKPVIAEVSDTACGRPTEFEVITVLAILHYAAARVDFVVWETGLGGRLDSTNVVTPQLSLITNVGYDHVAILGDTLEQIAAEKAGIIKPGVPVLTTATGAALDVISQTALEKGSLCRALGRDFDAERTAFGLEGQTFDWREVQRRSDADNGRVIAGEDEQGQGQGQQLERKSEPCTLVHMSDLRLTMLGEHQIFNASLAVAACLLLREQGVVITDQAIRQGLLNTRWAGRLELISRDPLILLDGAHNPQGAQALGQALGELLPDRRLVLVIGILADKAIPKVLSPILAHAAQVIVTAPDIPRAADVEEVAQVLRGLAPSLPVETAPTVREALGLGHALLQAPQDALVITGSLFTISEARTLLVESATL